MQGRCTCDVTKVRVAMMRFFATQERNDDCTKTCSHFCGRDLPAVCWLLNVSVKKPCSSETRKLSTVLANLKGCTHRDTKVGTVQDDPARLLHISWINVAVDPHQDVSRDQVKQYNVHSERSLTVGDLNFCTGHMS